MGWLNEGHHALIIAALGGQAHLGTAAQKARSSQSDGVGSARLIPMVREGGMSARLPYHATNRPSIVYAVAKYATR